LSERRVNRPNRRPKTAQRAAETQARPQSPLYLLTGALLGLVAGLILAWGIYPSTVVDVPPSSLSDEYRNQYRAAVALAFATSGDLGRAQARLNLLGDPDPVRALVSQAQLTLLDETAQREARALSQLAGALEALLASQETDVAAEGASAEDLQGNETLAATVNPGQGYALRDQELLCEADGPLLKIFVYDQAGNAQAGTRIVTRSDEGQDEFFTGLKPEVSPGYADFTMDPGVVYAIIVEGVEVINPLQAASCELADGEPAWGSWQLLVDAE
jgi:hypothetical protein